MYLAIEDKGNLGRKRKKHCPKLVASAKQKGKDKEWEKEEGATEVWLRTERKSRIQIFVRELSSKIRFLIKF